MVLHRDLADYDITGFDEFSEPGLAGTMGRLPLDQIGDDQSFLTTFTGNRLVAYSYRLVEYGGEQVLLRLGSCYTRPDGAPRNVTFCEGFNGDHYAIGAENHACAFTRMTDNGTSDELKPMDYYKDAMQQIGFKSRQVLPDFSGIRPLPPEQDKPCPMPCSWPWPIIP